MTPIDLSQLPAPTVIDPLDYEQLLAERKDRLIELTDANEREALRETLKLESEPLTKFLEESAYRELMLRQQQNDRARALMLAYAEGPELDHIGATYYLTERLTIDAGDPNTRPPVAPTMESDGDYKRRILLAHDAYSTAGSRQAYRYWSLGASPDAKDAEALRPLPGAVRVYVLSRQSTGEAPAELLADVEAALNAEEVRPLSDTVTVRSAAIEAFAVRASLTLRDGPDAAVVAKEATRRAREYVNERHALGAQIVRGALESRLYAPGVERVEMIDPVADIGGDISSAPYCTSIEVVANE